jgi:hypothetical protein
VLNVKDPSESESDGSFEFYAHQWVICAERIGPGQVGLVWIRGACPAYLRIPDETDIPAYASLEWRENQLTASEGGTAEIIWQSGTSEDLAIVELGKPSPDVPIPIRNTTGLVAPFGGIAEVVGADSDDTLQFVQPTGDDEENVLLIANFDIRANGYGFGWESEAHTVLWNGAAPAVGDRLGSQTGSWYGAESSDGTFLLRAVRGGTALGFFTKPEVGVVFPSVQLQTFRHTQDDNPNTNYPNNWVRWTLYVNDYNARGFCLLDPANAPYSGTYSHVLLDMITPNLAIMNAWNSSNTWSMRFNVYEVTDAGFDPTTVTWNNQGLLTTNLVAAAVWDNITRINMQPTGNRPGFVFGVGARINGFEQFTLSGAYGFMFEWQYWSGPLHAQAVIYNRFGNTPRQNKLLAL